MSRGKRRFDRRLRWQAIGKRSASGWQAIVRGKGRGGEFAASGLRRIRVLRPLENLQRIAMLALRRIAAKGLGGSRPLSIWELA